MGLARVDDNPKFHFPLMMAGSNPAPRFLGGPTILVCLGLRLRRTWFEQPYGAKGAICQTAAEVPGLPLLAIVVPFISQM